MTKARTLANFISDNNEFADGTISVAEVSGAAPLASPSFTGTVDVSNNITVGGNDTIIAENNVGFKPSGAAYFDHHTVGQGMYFRLSNASSLDRTVFELGPDFATFNNGGHDQDFRVESDGSTHMLFVDAGNNRVGVFNSSPSSQLDISGAGAPRLTLTSTSGPYGYMEVNTVGSVGFGADPGTTGASTNMAFNVDNVETARFYASSNVFNEGSNDIDFRVESNDRSNAIFLDGASGTISFDVYDFMIVNNDDGPGLTVTSGRDYNSLLMGAAANYGSNNSTENKWSWNWRGRPSSSTQHYNFLYDEIGNKEMFRVEADASQTAVVVNEGANDVDFRVEGITNNNLFFVDASTNRIGIKNSGPTAGALSFDSSATVPSGDSPSGAKISLYGNNNDHLIGVDNGGAYHTTNTSWKVIAKNGSTYAGDLLTLTTGTNGATFNEGSQDIDFRVESNNLSHMLYVDATNDNVGIGTSAPANFSGYVGLTTYGASLGSFLQMTGASCTARFVADSSSNTVQIKSVTAHPVELYTSDTVRARWRPAGMYIQGDNDDSFYNTTANTGVSLQGSSQRDPGNGAALQIACDETEGWANIYLNRHTHTGSRDRRFVQFQSSAAGGTVGGIEINSSDNGTNYNTTSDYRLKENIVDLTDGITRVKQLQPRRFNFIADETDTVVDGFIAHEVDTIVPEAVTGEKDAMKTDEGGNNVIAPQAMDASRLVPLLTAALQEAITKIETLEARITALENA